MLSKLIKLALKCVQCGFETDWLHRCDECGQLFCYDHLHGVFTGCVQCAERVHNWFGEDRLNGILLSAKRGRHVFHNYVWMR